ncbi:putative mitochondrial inner membrane protein [Kockovaella imperatae]|uniref:Putative mitochondrial inner membrane protein n=1 Tax=Kockovaella imperatae TaxID=4999 RepID=A0A1Y1UIA0_9TREE|nr:putative mitochondrial inner membrane protein [Kockovaella imperatae]ORX37793.1 putative mitochondrial inner membrane protein [Kockovaella imperatae]
MFRPRPATAGPQQPEAGPSTQQVVSKDAALHNDQADPALGAVVAPPGASAPEGSFVSRMMADNPYFSAGAGLMGIGVVLASLRRSIRLGATFAQRRLLVTLEIPSKDRSYPWFLDWMAVNAPQPNPAEGRTSLRSLLKGKSPMALPSHELAVETNFKQHENGSTEAVFNLVPGPGTHYFRYAGAWFQVKRERDAKLMDLHSGTPWETLTLTTLASSRHLLASLLSEARNLAENHIEGKTLVYTAWGMEWRPFGKPRRRRQMGSVVLADGVSERVEADIKGFLGRGKWYAERGIPYRRGYLLHGPPGSGKTSFIQALAGSVSYNICLLNLAERGLTDDKLNHLLGLVPERSFILLEDVDSAFSRRVQTTEDGFKSSVTFSGLLNALDGVASSEERIIFMTTNHLDRLDPALIRPGRVDVHELLDDAHGEQAQRLFTKFYGSSESGEERVWREGEEVLEREEIERLGSQVKEIVDEARSRGQTISMATLQGLFIRSSARDGVSGITRLCQGN